MKRYRVVGTARRRRCAGVVTAVGAGVLAIGSVAWACTLQTGTITVCNPPSFVYVNGFCAKKTGSGGQVGSVKILKVPTAISVVGENFYDMNYSILLRQPLSTSNCHDYRGSGIHSVIGYNLDGTPRTVRGWTGGKRIFATPALTPLLPNTGGALMCVQDEPGRVTGNQVSVAVI